jgi:Uma2 family endonuclease
MIQAPPKLSLTEFLALPETKPANEFIQGQITQKPMPQGKHSRIQQKLTSVINLQLEDSRISLALPELRCNFGGRSLVPDVVVFKWQSLVTTPDGAIANQFNRLVGK